MKRNLLYMVTPFIFISVFAARPMTSLFANELEATMFEIGMITACYSIAPLIIAIFAGRYIDRYGERIPIFIGSLGLFISLCLPYFFPSVQILFISQLILGGSQLLAILAIQNGVAKSTTNKNRDRSVGTFSLFSSAGMLLGPIIGGYSTEHYGFQLSFMILAFVPFVPMVLSFFITKSSRTASVSKKEKSTSMKELFRIPGLSRAVLVSMIILSALDIFYVYFPLYAQSIGLNFSQIGLLLGAQAASNVLVRIFMPRLIMMFGRVTVLWIFMMIGAISYGMIPFLHEFSLLFAASFLLGAGLGVTQPLTIVLSYNVSPPGQTGEVLGIRLAANRLGQTIIPFVFANLSTLIGLGPILFMKAIVLAAGAITARGIIDKVKQDEMSERKVKVR
ncbi:MFS transporter [Metabacillus sediminilitoris]|uniref:MFS transporter n=1 Tax=Metabacillus sediminilitoris TaxID=2567941 RepID=A0A4S4BLM9_9BACI|nr:MFS transporter [Metabacillus sediminilitoris]QGQ45616.1 MFS transporter [Metabacillus sediminilitoris]THF75673.1 MFS transporter [Metabacillus sediminilitoris]